MTVLRLAAFLLLGLILSVSACGKKGDPIRPGDEPLEEQLL